MNNTQPNPTTTPESRGRHNDPTPYAGQATPIDGVVDSSTTITGTRIERADPVDLPAGDQVAGLVLMHVPRYLDPGRHHQPTPADYLAWLVEIVDEAERILETGGRLVLVAKPLESDRPRIDVPNQLLQPLATAGFTTPMVHTWLPQPTDTPTLGDGPGPDASGVLERSARSWWRVLITSKGHEHRAGTPRQRRQLGLPHSHGHVPDHLTRLAGRAHWPITTACTQGGGVHGEVAQGVLPGELVSLIVSCFSYIDDVIVSPLTGPTTVVADTARQLGRRALCFEPDHTILNHLNQPDRGPSPTGGEER